MALNPGSAFTGRITAPDADYPYGSSKDETSAGAGDGTPYQENRANDVFGMQQAILDEPSIVPSGNADTVLASDYLNGIKSIAAHNDYSAVINYRIGSIVAGSDDDIYIADAANGPASSVVDPVGDVGGTWVTLSSKLSSPSVIAQIVQTQTGAVATGSTVMVLDDTVPQNTEGDEYITLAITPTSATNRLLIFADWFGGNSNVENQMMIGLFQDAVVNGLAANGSTTVASANRLISLSLVHGMVAGTTSSITFKVRVGGNNSGTTTFNGLNSSRVFAAVGASGIKIIEYTP